MRGPLPRSPLSTTGPGRAESPSSINPLRQAARGAPGACAPARFTLRVSSAVRCPPRPPRARYVGEGRDNNERRRIQEPEEAKRTKILRSWC
jgi:hypothetical protein